MQNKIRLIVDCAIAANADYIVSEDRHFSVLKSTAFPKVEVRRLNEFYQELIDADSAKEETYQE